MATNRAGAQRTAADVMTPAPRTCLALMGVPSSGGRMLRLHN